MRKNRRLYFKRNYQIAPLAFMKNLDNAFVILTKRKHDAFPNENVPNRMGKVKFILVTLDRLIYLEELFQVLKKLY
jgi:hypothetical protein